MKRMKRTKRIKKMKKGESLTLSMGVGGASVAGTGKKLALTLN